MLRRHVVVVLVDRFDMATARALQYARTLSPDDLRAVHFDIDTQAARSSRPEWSRLGPGPAAARHHRVPGPPARPGRPGAGGRADGRRRHRVHRPAAPARATPRLAALPARPHGRQYRRRGRPGAPRDATIVPFNLTGGRFASGCALRPLGEESPTRPSRRRAAAGRRRRAAPAPTARTAARRPSRPATAGGRATLAQRAGATSPSRDVAPRQRVRVAGRVKSVRVQPRAGDLEPRVRPERRLGRPAPRLPGPAQDRRASSPGPAWWSRAWSGTWGRRPAMLNPSFELVAGRRAQRRPSGH